MTDDRAQVETFGFSTIFGVVALMILLVTVTVYPAIAAVEESQQVANVERGMLSLSDNVDDVVRNDASSRSTRLRLDRGQLSLGAPVTLTVSGTSFSESFTVRPLVYRSGDGVRLVYASGAVMRAEDGGTAVVDEPRLVVSAQSLVLPVVSLQQGDGPTGVSGTTRVVTTRTDRRLAVAETSAPSSVTITVDSPRAPAWSRMLENQGLSCSSPSPDTTTCSPPSDPDQLYVSLVEVRVAFR